MGFVGVGDRPQGVLLPTLDLYGSADALLLSLGLFLLAFLTIVLVRSRRRALLVLYTLVLAGFVQAVYGSLMMLSGMEWGFLEPKEYGRGLATGTFINRPSRTTIQRSHLENSCWSSGRF